MIRLCCVRAGDTDDKEYPEALNALIIAVTDTAGFATPPTAALLKGLARPGEDGIALDALQKRARWMSFKDATGASFTLSCMTMQYTDPGSGSGSNCGTANIHTILSGTQSTPFEHAGWDMLILKKMPTPIALLQQAAYGVCAVADGANMPPMAREVVIDLLEEVFQLISDKTTMPKFKAALDAWKIDAKRFQFCLMRTLCVIYVEARIRTPYCSCSSRRLWTLLLEL